MLCLHQHLLEWLQNKPRIGSAAKLLVLSWDAAMLTAAVILDAPTTRLTSSDTLDTPDTGVATTLGVNAGGSDYTTGAATVTGGSANLTVNLVVNTGAPSAISLATGGSTYGATGTAVAVTGGTGSNMTVDFTSLLELSIPSLLTILVLDIQTVKP